MLGLAAKSLRGGLRLIDVPPLLVSGVLSSRPGAHSMEIAMANKEQRGNREKRKPKKEKPKPAPHISTFSGAMTKGAVGKKSHT
jgi:hypothetical protein